MKTSGNIACKMTLFFTTVIIALFAALTAYAGNDWELKSNEGGIKVFTASQQGSNIKAMKAEFNAKGTPEMLAGLLLDINKQPDWVYSTKSSTLIKNVGEYELVYYTEKSMPWPLSNRDAVIHVKITQDPETQIMTVNSNTIAGTVKEKKGIVRIPSSSVTWKVTPVNGNEIKVEYTAQADPGGSVPAWITNMFLTKGPLETFRKLREMLEEKGLGS